MSKSSGLRNAPSTTGKPSGKGRANAPSKPSSTGNGNGSSRSKK